MINPLNLFIVILKEIGLFKAYQIFWFKYYSIICSVSSLQLMKKFIVNPIYTFVQGVLLLDLCKLENDQRASTCMRPQTVARTMQLGGN